MNKIKIVSIFGVRPEAVKMAPVIKELERYPDLIESVVAVTGQHREMLDQILKLFEIKADYDLNIMRHGQSLSDIFVRALKGLEEVLHTEKPDIVLVHGDTSTSFIGSLASFYQKISVGHVEAGLRTFDKYRPYPEEINRRLTGVLADIHFAPTNVSKDNLLREGVANEDIFITGNTVIDALKYTVKANFEYRTEKLVPQPWKDGRMILMEVHRRENWGMPIRQVCLAAREIVKMHEDVWIVFPVHKNPVVRDVVFEVLGDHERVILVEPLDTDEFHNLMAEAYFMLSDSGGVQEEAPALGTPVLIARDVTERPEAIRAGTVKLVGTQKEEVFTSCTELLNSASIHKAMSQAINPYGDGRASARIVAAILHYFGFAVERPHDWSSS